MMWMRGVLAAAVCVGSLLGATGSALAADQLQDTRTLFLTERFTPSSVRGPLTSGSLPEQMVTMLGEREGFQVALNNATGGALALDARVNADAALTAAMGNGTISLEMLRVLSVNLPTASSKLGTSPGRYADPLPPFRSDRAPQGLLAVPAGEWGGAALIAHVRTNATAGVYSGTYELFSGTTVYARVAFSLDVRGVRMPQNGEANTMKTVMNVEGDAYWSQHDDMKAGSQQMGIPYADRMLQLQGLLKFVDGRGVTPLEMPFATVSKVGTFSCSWITTKPSARPFVPARSFIEQINRYFAPQSDANPGSTQFLTRMAPGKTTGCDPSSEGDDFHGTLDKYRTPGLKQDDVMDPKAPAFWKGVYASYNSNGLLNGSTYVKNPFDEPGTATPKMKAQMSVEVPKATKAINAAFRGKAKVVMADWPRDTASKRVCRNAKGSQSCAVITGDEFSNKKQWDGKGSDDPKVWLVPQSRMFGRTTPPNIKKYGVNRDREYADRLAKVKKLRGGREIWAYNFYTAEKRVPQLSIDAPGTDSRLQYWLLAKEGHTGLFVSNFMLGWGPTQKNAGGTIRKGNPWTQTPYFKHSTYGVSAGWGTFIYPGYYPTLGLDGETQRNTGDATPVTSLRLEGMRDGAEDADLAAAYKARFGSAALATQMKGVFPGAMNSLAGTPMGNVVFPKYDNGNNLAQRMENVRRAMITQLSS